MATLMLASSKRAKRPVARTRVGRAIRHPIASLPHGVQKFVAAHVDAFGASAKGAWIPNSWAKPSVKSDQLLRGMFPTSLDYSHNFVFIHPASCSDRPSMTHVMINNDAMTKNVGLDDGQSGFVNKYSIPHIWTAADYGNVGSQFTTRAVSTALRIKYIGHNLAKGGNIVHLRLADHQPLIGAANDMVGEDPPKYNITNLTFEQLYEALMSNRYMRLNSFLHNTEIEYSYTNRPDAAYRNDWHFIRRKNHSRYSEVQGSSASATFGTCAPIISAMYWQTTDSKQQWQYELISHIEAKSDRLAQIATPSPAHPTEHGEIQQHIDRAHELHNETPEKPLLNHILSTIKTEATSVASTAGRNLFANMMAELKKPSTYETIGTGLLAGLI